MHIVAFSINPLFPDRVMGGAPKHLQSIAIHLGKLGHQVTILCTGRSDSNQPFKWHENVEVLPMLRFHQPFPQPYAAPAYDLAAVVQDVGEYLARADRFYMHDGEFLFPYVYQDIPTVVSLRDNVYPETLLGGFLFQGDSLILISEYQRQYFLDTAGRFIPEMADRAIVIHNGVDWDHFKPTPPKEILDIVPVQPGEYPIVLHPHRPEETKGIRQTIEVVDLLVHKHGITNLRTLVPKWLDLKLSAELRAFYDDIQGEIDGRGLTENFIFHDWIPQPIIPQYYSLGSVTLALGSFVESFGNAVYESLGCGTPSIPVRISSHREILPENLIDKVDFGDAETAAHIAAQIIQENRRTSPETMAYLHEHYNVQKQRDAYADAILNAKRHQPMPYKFSPMDDSTRFGLPVWCYRARKGVYHDFRVEYLQSADFDRLIATFPIGFTFADAQTHNVSRDDVLRWYRDGYLTPRQ